MPQRTYSRGALASINRNEMDALIDVATGLIGCQTAANATTIFVDHPSLSSANDVAITSVISAYVPLADYGIPPEIVRLRTFYADLLQWQTDAEGVDTGWTGILYITSKDAAIRVLFRRMALLCKAMRDLLFVLGKQQ